MDTAKIGREAKEQQEESPRWRDFNGSGRAEVPSMSKQMTNDDRFDRIDASIEQMGERLSRYILDLRQETRAGMQSLSNRIDVLSAAMSSIDSRIPALTKAVIDAGAMSTQLLLEQSRQKMDFGSRLEKLEETVAKLLNPAA